MAMNFVLICDMIICKIVSRQDTEMITNVFSFNFVVRLVWKNTNPKRQEYSDQNMCSMSSKLAGIKKCVLCTQRLMMSSVAIVTISHNALPFQLTSVNPVNLFWLCLLHLTIASKVRTIWLYCFHSNKRITVHYCN